MDESYAGQQVVGLDLHRRTVMVRMTPAGERLEAVRFASDPAVLAEQIAKAGRPEAWIAPKHVRCQRELVRHRHKLRQLCSGLKAGAHAVLAKNALLIPRSDMFGVDGRHRIRRLALPQAYRVHLDSQLHLIDAFEAEIEDLDGRIRGLFDAEPFQVRMGHGPDFSLL